jgi:hypothetical protein
VEFCICLAGKKLYVAIHCDPPDRSDGVWTRAWEVAQKVRPNFGDVRSFVTTFVASEVRQKMNENAHGCASSSHGAGRE